MTVLSRSCGLFCVAIIGCAVLLWIVSSSVQIFSRWSSVAPAGSVETTFTRITEPLPRLDACLEEWSLGIGFENDESEEDASGLILAAHCLSGVLSMGLFFILDVFVLQFGFAVTVRSFELEFPLTVVGLGLGLLCAVSRVK